MLGPTYRHLSNWDDLVEITFGDCKKWSQGLTSYRAAKTDYWVIDRMDFKP